MPFRIQVANDGPLDANQVSLLVEGLNGTKVQSNGINPTFVDSFTISGAFFGNVPGHSNGSDDPGPVLTTGDPFHFKQGSDAPARDLVRVSVAGWSSKPSTTSSTTTPRPTRRRRTSTTPRCSRTRRSSPGPASPPKASQPPGRTR